jgi:hypothetical protein
MRYQWQDEAESEIIALMAGLEIDGELPKDFQILGLFVAKKNTNEACYIYPEQTDTSPELSSIIKDVLNEIQNRYNLGIKTEEAS